MFYVLFNTSGIHYFVNNVLNLISLMFFQCFILVYLNTKDKKLLIYAPFN